MSDHYATLGVPRAAKAEEIRAAYLTLARDRHPDRVRDPEARKHAVEFFKELTAAYDVLSRDRARRDYDSRHPAAGQSAAPTRPAAPAASPASPPAERAKPIESGRVNFDALANGIEAFRKADYHTAVQLLNIAVTRDEKDHRAHAFLGMALAKNPNWVRDGIHHLETATRLQPRNPVYHSELALLFHGQGLKLRARKSLDAALAIQPDHPDVLRAARELPPAGDAAAPGEGAAAPTTGEVGRNLLSRLKRR